MNSQDIDQYISYQLYFTKSLTDDIVKFIDFLKNGFNKKGELEGSLIDYQDQFSKEKWTEIINNWIDYLRNISSDIFINKIEGVLNMNQSLDKDFLISLVNLIFSQVKVKQFGDYESVLEKKSDWWGGRLESDPVMFSQDRLINNIIKLFGGELSQHLFININRDE